MDDNPVEIVNSLLPEYSELLLSDECIVVSIFSKKDDAINIKNTIIRSYNILEENILYFGLKNYDDSDFNFLIYLLLIKYKKEKITLLNPCSENELKKNITPEELLSNKKDNLFRLINKLPKKYNPYILKEHLIHLKKIIRYNISHDIYPHMIEPINIFIDICDCELELISCNENLSISKLSSLSEKKSYQLTDYSILHSRYKKNYDYIKKNHKSSSFIEKRLAYLKQTKYLVSKLDSEINQKEVPWIILWLTSLFLLRSEFYKNNHNYSASLSMCIRSFELYSKASLIRHSSTECNFIRGRFYLEGRPILGVGKLFGKIKDINIVNIDTSNLDTLIKCRNQSTFGHGLSSCNEEIATSSYNEIKKIIENTEFYKIKSPRTGRTKWQELLDQAITNPLTEIFFSLSSITIEKITTKL